MIEETAEKTTHQESSSVPATMQELLAEAGAYHSVRRGEIVEGVVIRVDQDAVLVDVGTKSEAIIPYRELRCLGPAGTRQLKVGDEVLAYVLQSENEERQVILSLDRAEGEKGWRYLQQCCTDGEMVEGTVTGFNRGGLLVNTHGVQGFVPLSQIATLPPDSQDGEQHRLAPLVDQCLQLKVLEINRQRNRIILSERAAQHHMRQERREHLLQELREGEIRRGRVSGIREFGVFVDLGGLDGLVPLSEVSWDPEAPPEQVVKPGDEVEVSVMRVNPETGRVALSLRRANAEPWTTVAEKYQVGQLVTGTITKLATFGAFARLEGPVEGLIHISELADHRVGHPKEVVQMGDVVTLRIVRMEPERRRVGLSLRRAQDPF